MRTAARAFSSRGAPSTETTTRTTPRHVGDFHLDRFEITVGRFNRFVAAGQGLQSTAPQTGSGKNDLDVYDPGWDVAWNIYLATTSQGLATNVQCINATYLVGRQRLADELPELVRGLRLLYLGRRPPSHASRVVLCGRWRRVKRRPACLPLVRPAVVDDCRQYLLRQFDEGRRKCRLPLSQRRRQMASGRPRRQCRRVVADYAGAYPLPCYNCTNRGRRAAPGDQRRFLGSSPIFENGASGAQVTPDTREGVYGARCARR